MQLKTILNRVQKFKHFVYGDVRWEDGDDDRGIEKTNSYIESVIFTGRRQDLQIGRRIILELSEAVE